MALWCPLRVGDSAAYDHAGRHPAPEWPRNPQLACRAAAPGRALLLLTGEPSMRGGASSAPAAADDDDLYS